MNYKKNFDEAYCENTELKNFDYTSDSLDSASISFSNCESFKEMDFLEKTEDNFNTIKSNIYEEDLIWSSRLTNSQFLKIKYSFNTLFKINYPNEFYTKISNKTYHTITGITKSSDVICFAILNINFTNRSCEILSFGVLKEFQGRHYGSKLMQKLTEELKIMGLTEISLIVQKTNRIAISLYEKFGFKVIMQDSDYYNMLEGDDRKALIMNKSMSLEQFWIFKVFKNIAKKFMF